MSSKRHTDYLNEIGRTTETYSNFGEKRWNQFYFRVHKAIVKRMLGKVDPGRVILDLGTSYGQWHDFLRQRGFDKVLGVEVDSGRADVARTRGYDQVFTTDGAQIPLPDSSVDVVVSNGVFVHIIRYEDKIAVLKEMERLLKAGGTAILSHTMAKAQGYDKYTVVTYMSFLTLAELIDLVRNNTTLLIEDMAPTYYHFRNRRPAFLVWVIRKALRYPLPFLGELLYLLNILDARTMSVEEADAVYLRLTKPKHKDL